MAKPFYFWLSFKKSQNWITWPLKRPNGNPDPRRTRKPHIPTLRVALPTIQLENGRCRERKKVWENECVWVRERVSMCVCERERERESKSKCVCKREGEIKPVATNPDHGKVHSIPYWCIKSSAVEGFLHYRPSHIHTHTHTHTHTHVHAHTL